MDCTQDRALAEARRVARVYAARGRFFWWCAEEDLRGEATREVLKALPGFDPAFPDTKLEAFVGRVAALACVEYMRKMGSPASGPKRQRARVLEGTRRASIDRVREADPLMEILSEERWGAQVRVEVDHALRYSPDVLEVLNGRPCTHVAPEFGLGVDELRRRVTRAKRRLRLNPVLQALRDDLVE